MTYTESKRVASNGDTVAEEDKRAPYAPPRVEKKRALTRVTLFSGAGAAGTSGLTAL